MGSEPVNYEAVLADLMSKRDALDKAIAAISTLVGIAPPASPGEQQGEVGGSEDGAPRVTIPEHAFFSLSALDAIKKLLGMKKKPLTAKVIVDDLQAGGWVSSSKNAYSTVFTALTRSNEKGEEVINVNGKWGLAEWFPGRRPNKGNKGTKDTKSGGGDVAKDPEAEPGAAQDSEWLNESEKPK